MTRIICKKGKPDEKQKRCYDCCHNGAYTSVWWCHNEEAIKWRGTRFAGVSKCPFWEPCIIYNDLKFWDKFFWYFDSVYIENEEAEGCKD